MERRTFLSWVGIGWIATSLPVAIAFQPYTIQKQEDKLIRFHATDPNQLAGNLTASPYPSYFEIANMKINLKITCT